jgi:hypothetical protein
MVIVQTNGGSATANYLMDIGIGAATEAVLIPNLCHSQSAGGNDIFTYMIPIRVPIGSRLTARCQSTTISATLTVNLTLLPMGPKLSCPFNRVTEYGPSTATSRSAAVVDPGATINTKGAYTQIVAATTNQIEAIVIALDDANDSARVSVNWLLDIAVGAATESIIVPNFVVVCNSATDKPYPATIGPIPIAIPAGSRISARAQSSNATAGDRTFGISIYGLD